MTNSPRSAGLILAPRPGTSEGKSYSSADRSEIANSQSQIGNENGWPKLSNGKPDFNQMTSGQRRVYDAARLKRIYGDKVLPGDVIVEERASRPY